MIPRLLRDASEVFSVNGYGALNGTVSAIVTEELNGEYSLTMELSADDPLFEYLHVGSVIAAMPNKTDARQAFIAEHISKPIEGICEIYATHIAQFRAHLIPVAPFSANSLAEALTAMVTNSLETNPFTITTDKVVASAMTTLVPHTFRELMGGVEGSLLDTYGGEYKYDNFSIELLARRGRPSTDLRVFYGRNMTEFELEEDFSWTDSLTGVIPFWESDEAQVVGSIQYAPNHEDYAYARTGVLDCTEHFEDIPTTEQLNTYASQWIADKGNLAVNLEAAFDHLQNADSSMQIGDTITVINSMYNVNLKRRIVATEFNVLSEEYETVTIGDLKATISDAIEGMDTDTPNDNRLMLGANNIAVRFASNNGTASIQFRQSATEWYMLVFNSTNISFRHTTDGGATYTTIWTK